MKKFKCMNCGSCCRFGENGYLPLYYWEVKNIKKISLEKKLKPNIKPVTIFYDSISKIYFSVIYGLFNNPCIFRKHNCTIYKDRPFVCRAYPLFWTPKYLIDGHFGIHCFGYCKNYDNQSFLDNLQKHKLNTKILSLKSEKNYGKSYLSCLKSNKINLRLSNILGDLESKKKVSLIRTLNPNSEKVLSFDEFLIKTNLFSKSQIKQMNFKFKLARDEIK